MGNSDHHAGRRRARESERPEMLRCDSRTCSPCKYHRHQTCTSSISRAVSSLPARPGITMLKLFSTWYGLSDSRIWMRTDLTSRSTFDRTLLVNTPRTLANTVRKIRRTIISFRTQSLYWLRQRWTWTSHEEMVVIVQATAPSSRTRQEVSSLINSR